MPGHIIFLDDSDTWRYYHSTHLHQYDVWFLRYGARKTIFCHFGLFFALFPHHSPSPNVPRKKFFDKMKKKPEDIIILQMCTINDNHMMYGS